MFSRILWLVLILVSVIDAVDREVTLETVRRVREAGFSSVIELARFDLRHDRKNAAMQKLARHLREKPRDMEAYLLLAELMQENSPAMAEKLLLRARQNGVESPRLDRALLRLQEAVRSDLNQAGASILETGFEKPFMKMPRAKPSASRPRTSPQTRPTDRSEHLSLGLMMRLKALDSLFKRWKASGRSETEFSIKSLRGMGWLTYPMKLPGLMPLRIEDGSVASDCCGTVDAVSSRLKDYLQALKQVSEQNPQLAIKTLEAIQQRSAAENELLFRLYQRKGFEQKTMNLLAGLQEFPNPDMRFTYAEALWKAGRGSHALEHYKALLDSTFHARAQSRIRLIESGASARLRELLDTQLEQASP